MTRRRPYRQGGLTLIEVLVAVTVVAMMSITIATAVSQTGRTRDIVEDSHERLHQVRSAFNMMANDLSSAYLSLHRATMEPTHDTVFIGQDHGDDDSVDFYSFTHQRRYYNVNESDQCEVGYFIDEDPEISGQNNLIRREAPMLDLEPLEGGQYLILVEDVTAFDLQYFDFAMNEWQDAWDTTEALEEGSRLPYQVRIKLAVNNRLGEEVVYGTQLPVPMRTPIWRKPFIPGPPAVVNK